MPLVVLRKMSINKFPTAVSVFVGISILVLLVAVKYDFDTGLELLRVSYLESEDVLSATQACLSNTRYTHVASGVSRGDRFIGCFLGAIFSTFSPVAVIWIGKLILGLCAILGLGMTFIPILVIASLNSPPHR